ncbi:hypothetical protein OUZ56_030962 [Daphnia magna]|uniref:Uncharacterized protein n=1 Tax=Daphnia magna TaxID=35525 RepID=A0ABQ9ZT71_9CRUS|nr:hypothetical protein OUZ56_030962 [Daphnia magna]
MSFKYTETPFLSLLKNRRALNRQSVVKNVKEEKPSKYSHHHERWWLMEEEEKNTRKTFYGREGGGWGGKSQKIKNIGVRSQIEVERKDDFLLPKAVTEETTSDDESKSVKNLKGVRNGIAASREFVMFIQISCRPAGS